MKLTTLFVLATLLTHANSFSQKNRITLSMNNVSVLEVINEIEANTEFRFIYKIKEVEVSNKVSLNVKKERIEKVLDILFPNKLVGYKILNEQVVLKKLNNTKTKQVIGNTIRQQTVSGNVTDIDGIPLPGVSVIIKGTYIGAETDFDGYYELDISNSNSILSFSYLGYVTQEIPVDGQRKINPVLLENTEQLQEVVIQAYRTTTNTKNTAAITTVTSDVVESKPNISVLNSLQARVAGLSIGSGNGQPGAPPEIILRGVGSLNGNRRPLFVIDGVPVNGFNFRAINPNDIESVSVLKDAASASAYGNRGANGVIIITTKKGDYESGLQIDYATSYGRTFQQDNKFNLMNSRDLLNLQKRLNIGVGAQLTDAEINVLANQNNTDWTEFIFQNGETQNNQIGISFGGEHSKSYTSFSHAKQEGILKNTGLERFTVRSNVTGKSKNEKFDYGLDATIGFAESERAFNIGGELVFFNPLIGALWGQPFLNPFRADGTVNDDSIASDQAYPLSLSPYVILNNFRYGNGIVDKNIKSVIGTNASYEILDNLKFKGRIGIDYNQNEFLSVVHPESSNRRFYPQNGEIQGRQIESFARDLLINTNLSLNYNKAFGNHSIDASVFFENINFHRKSFGFTQLGLNPRTFSPGDGDGFINGDLEENGDFLYIPRVNSNKGKAGLLSYFAIAEYDYDNRFGLFATLRRDASFRFIGDNKWGTFYSVSGRWNIDKESFIGPDSIISTLKLRASYGTSGNEQIGGSDILSRADVTRTLYTTGNGYNNTVSFPVANLGNPEVKWETTIQTNIGIDYGLFRNKLRGTLDLYNKKATGLFAPLNISAANGQYSIDSNAGTIRNRGAEFSMEYDVISNNKFKATITGNIAYNENEILALDSGDQDFTTITNAVGHPVGAYYLVPYVGVNPANGNALYRTKEGNITEVFDTDDRVIIDDAVPKIQGGFGLNLDYKGFFLQSNFSFVGNYKRYNDQQRFFQQDPRQSLNFNVSANYNRAWTPDNPITDVEGLFSTQNNFGSDKFLHDASYLRLRYLSVGYNLPNQVLNVIGLKALRIYLQGENLLTWSKWQGLDVESNSTRRFDFSDYPTPRIFTFGLDVKL